MDTSPDAPGANVSPQIVRYEGGDVLLNEAEGIVFEAARFPEIRKYAGEDVVFTDGTTLLGADDKAGIAAIVEMVARLQAYPSIPHAKICVGFTPAGRRISILKRSAPATPTPSTGARSGDSNTKTSTAAPRG